jgi:ADP-ribose pyrophosphatase YjhB (NUDIX family)
MPRHSVSVSGVVVRADAAILAVQRRDNGHWEPPGGVLEYEETFEDGVRREVLEETGVEIDVERLTGVYKNITKSVVALVFRCRPLTDAVSETEESMRVAWLTIDDVQRRMAPAYAVRVTDAFAAGVVVRAHDGVELLSSRIR